MFTHIFIKFINFLKIHIKLALPVHKFQDGCQIQDGCQDKYQLLTKYALSGSNMPLTSFYILQTLLSHAS